MNSGTSVLSAGAAPSKASRSGWRLGTNRLEAVDARLLRPLLRPPALLLLVVSLGWELLYSEWLVNLITAQGFFSGPVSMWVPPSVDFYGITVLWLIGGVYARARSSGVFTECYLAGLSPQRILAPYLGAAFVLFTVGGLAMNIVGFFTSYDPMAVRIGIAFMAVITVLAGAAFSGAGVVLLNVWQVPRPIQAVLYVALTFGVLFLVYVMSDWVTPPLRELYRSNPDAWYVSLVHPTPNPVAFVFWTSFYVSLAAVALAYLLLAPLMWKLAVNRNRIVGE